MDGPIQPKKPLPAAAGGETSSSTHQDPSVSDLSPDEYMAGIRQKLHGDQTPQRQASDATAVHPAAQATPPEAQGESFFHRLLHSAKLFFTPPGVSKEADQQARDMVRAIPRGAVNMANELGRTVLEFGAFLDRKTGAGELMQPGYNAAYDENGGARGLVVGAGDEANAVSEDEMLAAYGPKSDDPLVSLTENASQFLSGLALTRGLGIKNIYVGGGIVDATMLDRKSTRLNSSHVEISYAVFCL